MQIYVKTTNLVILQSIPSCLSNIHHEKGWCNFKHLLTRYKDYFNSGHIQEEKQTHTTNDIYDKQKQKQITSKTTANCPTLFEETLSILIFQDIIFKEPMEKIESQILLPYISFGINLKNHYQV